MDRQKYILIEETEGTEIQRHRDGVTKGTEAEGIRRQI
jgi:hypothetical protein